MTPAERIVESVKELTVKADGDRLRLDEIAHGLWQLREAVVAMGAKSASRSEHDYSRGPAWYDREIVAHLDAALYTLTETCKETS